MASLKGCPPCGTPSIKGPVHITRNQKRKGEPGYAGFAFSFEAAFQSLNTASAAASERQRDGVGAVACAGFANAVGEGASAAEVGPVHIAARVGSCG